jgi:hypothetical protein
MSDLNQSLPLPEAPIITNKSDEDTKTTGEKEKDPSMESMEEEDLIDDGTELDKDSEDEEDKGDLLSMTTTRMTSTMTKMGSQSKPRLAPPN